MTTTALFFLTDAQLSDRRAALLAADHDHRTAAELAAVEAAMDLNSGQ